MSFSIQTNVNSLLAQENLRVNSEFQSRTIQRLTSGYRINSSGDDAAGLAIANKFRSDTAELTQGVRNANDGISTLQIIDGGLNNISKILDRLKTLATQSSSANFTGNRQGLDSEYQSLLNEINRQAANIGLNQGGSSNKAISVYLGGGSSQANAQVSVDLSGSANQVDATGLGLKGTTIAGGGTLLTGNSTRLDNVAATFLAGSGSQTFTFQVFDSTTGAAASKSVTVTAGAGGFTGQQYVDAVNNALTQAGVTGVTASISSASGSVGQLQFASSRAFTVKAGAASAGTAGVTANSTASNGSNYVYNQAVGNFSAITGTNSEAVTFANGNGSVNVTFDVSNGDTIAHAIAAINAKTASIGIYATLDAAGTGISIQSNSTFTLTKTAASAGNGENVLGAAGTVGAVTVTAPTAGGNSGDNALNAITAINTAVQNIAKVQGRVGTGQNQLEYSIQLAQSQISSFSAAESRIRDTDVAAEAANLTKAQVLQQASIAAMAQANSAPQAVLALLRG